MKLPEGDHRSCGPLLVPRVAIAGVAGGGPRRIDQRCYQLAAATEAKSRTGQVQAEILEFIASAAGRVVESINATAVEACSGSDVDVAEQVATRDQPAAAWTDALATIYCDAVNLTIDYFKPPQQCPLADEKECRILRRGTRRSKMLVSDDGCSRLQGRMYMCQSHDNCRWHVPRGDASIGCTIVGDVMSRDFLVSGDFWPEALAVFQET